MYPFSCVYIGGDAWRITGEERAKHDTQFFTLKPVNGYISGRHGGTVVEMVPQIMCLRPGNTVP